MKQRLKHFSSILARRVLKFSNHWAAQYWHNNPLGNTLRAEKETYLKLWEDEKKSIYPEINSFEATTNHKINKEWMDDLALHTQIVIKGSPLCYQHGRIVYSALRDYMEQHPKDHLTIFETGTARGFSAIVMARALDDASASGKIITYDVLPHHTKMYWNCIDDHDGTKSRHDLLKPWRELLSKYVIFVEGDSKINLKNVVSDRINFAFLDGAHSYKDVTYEFETVAQYQRAGDVIIFDDYNTQDFAGLVRAVDKGCDRLGYDKKILSSDKERSYVIATKKAA